MAQSHIECITSEKKHTHKKFNSLASVIFVGVELEKQISGTLHE